MNSPSIKRHSTCKTPPLPNPVSPEQRLSVKDLAALMSRSVSGIWAAVKSGDFPPPERYGARCTRWRWGTVLDYLNQARHAGMEGER